MNFQMRMVNQVKFVKLLIRNNVKNRKTKLNHQKIHHKLYISIHNMKRKKKFKVKLIMLQI